MKSKKQITIIMMLLVLCICLFGCSNKDDATTTEPGEEVTSAISEDAFSASGESTTASQTAKEEETQPAGTADKTAVDIVTDGGVVLIGKIGKDANGWYFSPEEPINITFKFFEEKDSVYNGQTRIQMFDPADDGIEKAIYMGQTVTAAGIFRYYRDDFETLYFAPYTITLGKLAEKSYADTKLAAPDEPLNLYDPSQPLPKYMDAMIEDNKYSYNAFMLSTETLELMGNGFADFYVGFVDAFLNYKSEVPCSEKRYAEMLSTVIYDEFPLYNACAEPFNFYSHYDAAKGVVRIEYNCDKNSFDKTVKKFFAAANELLADVRADQTDVEKAKIIYHALSSRMTYDDSAMEKIERKESYYAYLHNSGVCITFATVYNQLLTQVGIRTTLAHCDIQDDYGHTWSMVTLDGKQYFCDPTYELNYDNGNGYRYFGMSYADRIADGTGADGIRYGRYYMYPVDAGMLAEESLKK